MKVALSVFLVICLIFDWTFGQPLPYILTSPYQGILAEREVQVYKSLKSYEDSLLQRLKLIDKYLQDYEDCQKGSYSAQENPIQATRMIRRFPKYVAPIKKHLKDGNLEQELFTSLNVFSPNTGYRFPGEDDYLETIEAFLCLQYNYNFKPSEIIDGIINGVQTGVGFTARQSLEIAAYALQSKFFTLSYEWLTAIREKHATNPKVIDTLENQLYAEHDRVFETAKLTEERYIFSSKISNTSKSEFPLSLREEMLAKLGKNRQLETHFAEHYTYLHHCNEKGSRTANETKELRCYFSFHAFYIYPVNVEEISVNPKILLYHKIIPEGWMERIKKISLRRIRAENANRPLKAVFDIFDATWLTDEDLGSSIPILPKIETLTGLQVRLNGSENFKIVVYGNGGHFYLHLDSQPGYKQGGVLKDFRKDSLETVLIYMTDVALGGATVFPKLGISVFPEKGSALYWPNFNANGDPQSNLLHASCPVLLGQKWIATQWIGIIGNGHGKNCSEIKQKKLRKLAWDNPQQMILDLILER